MSRLLYQTELHRQVRTTLGKGWKPTRRNGIIPYDAELYDPAVSPNAYVRPGPLPWLARVFRRRYRLPDDRVDLSLPLRARDDRRSARVAEDVGRGTVHVERAVDGEHRTDDDVHVRASQTDRLEDDEDHHESCRRNRGSADGGQQRRKDHDSLLHDRQVEAKNLGDEERAHTLEDRGPVHVYRRTHREHEGSHLVGDADLLLDRVERDGKGGTR